MQPINSYTTIALLPCSGIAAHSYQSLETISPVHQAILLNTIKETVEMFQHFIQALYMTEQNISYGLFSKPISSNEDSKLSP